MAILELIGIMFCVLKVLSGLCASWLMVVYVLTTDFRWMVITYIVWFIMGEFVTNGLGIHSNHDHLHTDFKFEWSKKC